MKAVLKITLNLYVCACIFPRMQSHFCVEKYSRCEKVIKISIINRHWHERKVYKTHLGLQAHYINTNEFKFPICFIYMIFFSICVNLIFFMFCILFYYKKSICFHLYIQIVCLRQPGMYKTLLGVTFGDK